LEVRARALVLLEAAAVIATGCGMLLYWLGQAWKEAQQLWPAVFSFILAVEIRTAILEIHEARADRTASTISVATILALLLLLPALWLNARFAFASVPSSPSAPLRLRALADEDAKRQQMPPDRWLDISEEAWRQRELQDAATVERLHTIDRSVLGADDRTLYDLLDWDLQRRLARTRLKLHLTAFDGTQLLAFLRTVPVRASRREYEARVQRFEAVPAYVRDGIVLMRQRIAARMLPGADQVRQLISELDVLLRDQPENSPIFAPFASMPDSVGDRTAIQRKALAAIREKVMPAFAQLRTFLSTEYLPVCPPAFAVRNWPNGAEVFREYVRLSTGADLSPEAIHAFGVSEVARIRTELAELMPKIAGDGALDEFLSQTSTDPAFYFSTADELLASCRAESARIAPLIPKVVRWVHASPVQVEAASRPTVGAAQYDASRRTILVNVTRLDLWPRFVVLPIMLHEGAPGHHLQFAVAQRPPYMNLRQSMGFTEGWALYAEGLGLELGVYTDPHAHFGRIAMELIRAVRAVVDTGIHARGWSLPEARNYFIAQTGQTERFAQAEVDRASVPAALLVYKVGEQRIKAVRARVAQSLGARFNAQAFHTTLLLAWGPLPLDVLDRKVDECLQNVQCSDLFSHVKAQP
jgi:uncharacterized protein (DUF885 family)